MKILVPVQFRKIVDGLNEINVEGVTVGEVLTKLIGQFEPLKERLYKSEGQLNKFLNLYVNDEDIRFLAGELTPVKDSDILSIIPASAGG